MSEAWELILPARRVSAPAALEVAESAEGLGWLGLWCSEVLGLEAMALLGAVAARTERLRLGTAIVPISTRSVALLAMAASTIEQLAPGRFQLGVGVGTPAIVARRHDRPVSSPVTEAEGALTVLGGLLGGERVSHPHAPQVEELRIEPPSSPPPVLLAALGPRMIELARRLADGVVLNFLPVDAAGACAEASRERAGERFEHLLLVRTCVDPTEADLEVMERELASYTLIPAYARHFRSLGFDLDAIPADSGLEDARTHLPDGMLEALEAVGSASACRERLAAYRQAGVTPLVLPVGAPDAMDRVLRALAP